MAAKSTQPQSELRFAHWRDKSRARDNLARNGAACPMRSATERERAPTPEAMTPMDHRPINY